MKHRTVKPLILGALMGCLAVAPAQLRAQEPGDEPTPLSTEEIRDCAERSFELALARTHLEQRGAEAERQEETLDEWRVRLSGQELGTRRASTNASRCMAECDPARSPGCLRRCRTLDDQARRMHEQLQWALRRYGEARQEADAEESRIRGAERRLQRDEEELIGGVCFGPPTVPPDTLREVCGADPLRSTPFCRQFPPGS